MMNISAKTDLCDKVDVVALDVADDHDLELGEEVQGKIADGIAKV